MDSQVHHPCSLPRLVSARSASAVFISTAVLLMTAALAGCTQHPNITASVEALRNTNSFDFVEQGSSSMVPHSVYTLGTAGTFQSPDRLSKRVRFRAYEPGGITVNRQRKWDT